MKTLTFFRRPLIEQLEYKVDDLQCNKKRLHSPARCGFPFKLQTGMRTTSFSSKHFFEGRGAEKHIIQAEEKQKKGLRFVLAELGFLAGFLAVGRCPGRKSVDCAKLAVRRRSQEAQLDEDIGFKMKLDSVIHLNCLWQGIFLGSNACSFLFTVRPSVCTDKSKNIFSLIWKLK